jgi:SAM-dependent methyltransferase
LAKGTVCVPGCGLGHDVRAWARASFAAYGFDIAPSAIQLATEATRAAGLQAHYQVADFLSMTPAAPFSWIFEHTLFCAIQPAQRQQYVEAVTRCLKPDGFYLAVNYFIPDRDGPPFGTDREEILRLFSPGFELLEDWVPRSYPNRTGLERMFWWKRT